MNVYGRRRANTVTSMYTYYWSRRPLCSPYYNPCYRILLSRGYSDCSYIDHKIFDNPRQMSRRCILEEIIIILLLMFRSKKNPLLTSFSCKLPFSSSRKPKKTNKQKTPPKIPTKTFIYFARRSLSTVRTVQQKWSS